MKSMCALCVGIILSFVYSVCYGGTYSGGTGSPEDPYRIETPADWAELTAASDDWG